jgi:hypothetical protein
MNRGMQWLWSTLHGHVRQWSTLARIVAAVFSAEKTDAFRGGAVLNLLYEKLSVYRGFYSFGGDGLR